MHMYRYMHIYICICIYIYANVYIYIFTHSFKRPHFLLIFAHIVALYIGLIYGKNLAEMG